MGSEKDAAKNVRQLFERALTAVGLHITKGAIIWEAFREFENVLISMVRINFIVIKILFMQSFLSNWNTVQRV